MLHLNEIAKKKETKKIKKKLRLVTICEDLSCSESYKANVFQSIGIFLTTVGCPRRLPYFTCGHKQALPGKL